MRRRFLIAVAIYVVAHLYIWWRLVLPLAAPWWQLATFAMVTLGPSFPLTIRVGRQLPRDAARPWLFVGYLWFGFATYFLLGAVASHVAIACGVDARAAAELCGGLAIAVVLAGLLNVARGAVVKRTRVPLRRLARPYTIAHLTDVHIGGLIGRDFAEQLVRRVNALEPDSVV